MLRYGFFDSEITGFDGEGMPIFDRAESSDFLAMFISRIISDGVLGQPGDCFQVLAGEGMRLGVRPGFAVIQGRFAVDWNMASVTVPEAPKMHRRIDRVVLRANYLERMCELVVKAGSRRHLRCRRSFCSRNLGTIMSCALPRCLWARTRPSSPRRT